MRSAAVLLLLCACVPHPPPGPLERMENVVFTRTSPLTGSEEIARRTLTPISLRREQQALATRGQALRDQPIDPPAERFTLYVPGGPAPKDGWGLIVWIWPFDEAARPLSWRVALARHGLIFVSPVKAGNDWNVLDRRLPLALLAWENVRAAYRLDPERVYIGGLSGGSRVAEITALAYPDVFRGALLDAGSDPIGGEQGMYKPPADLFRRFQTTRIVYVSGEDDERNLHDDKVSRDSMKEWCVLDTNLQTARHLGHQALDAPSLSRALDALDRRTLDPAGLQECNQHLEREMASALAAIEAAIARGDRETGRALLKAADARYAGPAAAKLVELDAQLQP